MMEIKEVAGKTMGIRQVVENMVGLGRFELPTHGLGNPTQNIPASDVMSGKRRQRPRPFEGVT
jgi:hypothetical protein